jgi:hypothetical protein
MAREFANRMSGSQPNTEPNCYEYLVGWYGAIQRVLRHIWGKFRL